MARPLRLEFPGAVYRITARGNAKQPIVADDRDRMRFIADGLGAESPWKSLQGQIWLGSDGFRDRMSRLVARQDLEDVPSGQSHPNRPSADEVPGVVSETFGIDRGEALDRSHQPAFKAAVYLLRRACNLPLAEVSRLSGVSPSRISRVQADIEHGGGDDELGLLLERYKVKN